MPRDEFSAKNKETLAKRVGTVCSNPDCRCSTYGPHTKSEKHVSRGVAAHISAAAAGGSRYDATITSEQRASIENGIWLCENCAKLIDSDTEAFPSDLLIEWKTRAEKRASKALKSPAIATPDPEYPQTIAIVARRCGTAAVYDRTSTATAAWWRTKVTLHPVKAPRDLESPWIPDSVGHVPNGWQKIGVGIQNQSCYADFDVKFDLRFLRSVRIQKFKFDEPNRAEVIAGGNGRNFLSIRVPELLPDERCGFWLDVRASKLQCELRSKRHPRNDQVFIFDVRHGTPQPWDGPPPDSSAPGYA